MEPLELCGVHKVRSVVRPPFLSRPYSFTALPRNTICASSIARPRLIHIRPSFLSTDCEGLPARSYREPGNLRPIYLDLTRKRLSQKEFC